jgi:molybdate-binding protein
MTRIHIPKDPSGQIAAAFPNDRQLLTNLRIIHGQDRSMGVALNRGYKRINSAFGFLENRVRFKSRLDPFSGGNFAEKRHPL